MKIIIISVCVFLLFFIICFYGIKPLIHSHSEKISIAMTGRSTMQLWFKHWNWPYPLRIKTTYKNWPIKYEKYSWNNLFLEYHGISGPKSNSADKPFGHDMLNDFESVLDSKKYDIAFFKYCFVDFKVKEDTTEQRYNNLIKTVKDAYKATQKRGMKMIAGTALPLTNSNDATVQLQKRYNTWLTEFSETKNDLYVFDLYTPLVDDNGKLKAELERGDGDPHFNDKAYSILDKSFFDKIHDWLTEGQK